MQSGEVDIFHVVYLIYPIVKSTSHIGFMLCLDAHESLPMPVFQLISLNKLKSGTDSLTCNLKLSRRADVIASSVTFVNIHRCQHVVGVDTTVVRNTDV